MIGSGTTRKYLLYAMGEIALVVIGILIALQINVRHQQYSNKKMVERIFEEVLEDLAADTRVINRYLLRGEKRDSIGVEVIENKVTADDYQNEDYLDLITFAFEPVSFSKNAYDRLINNLEIVPEKYLELVEELQGIYSLEANSINSVLDELRTFMDRVYYDYQVSQDWYSNSEDDHLAQRINYYLTSPKYKNDVKRFQVISAHMRSHHRSFIVKTTFAYNVIYKMIEPAIPFSNDITRFNYLQPDELIEYVGLYYDEQRQRNWKFYIDEAGDLKMVNFRGEQRYVHNIGIDTFTRFLRGDTLFFKRDSLSKLSSIRDVRSRTVYNWVKNEE